MKRIDTAIEIAAPPERVWRVLADFPRYGEWNPFITEISGELVVGRRLAIRIEPPGGRAMRFRPRVLVAEPGRALGWKGELLVAGLFDGEHAMALEPVDEGTRFVHAERFSGLLVPFFGLDKTKAGFLAMNGALKERVEAG